MNTNYIEIINQTGVSINYSYLYTVFDWMKSDALFQEHAHCSLKLTENNEIQQYNKRYRGNNQPTDVLAFPSDIDFVVSPHPDKNQSPVQMSQLTSLSFIGDIMIDLDVAKNDLEHQSLDHKVAELFVNGLLHLAGFDHITPQAKANMLQHENNYQQKIKIGIDLQ